MTRKSIKVLLAGVLAALGLIAGTLAATARNEPAATANQADDANEAGDATTEDAAEGPDTPISGPDLERASRVALDHLGEGAVTETEIEDEESYYEIEVTLADGRQIDVQVDENFEVVDTN